MSTRPITTFTRIAVATLAAVAVSTLPAATASAAAVNSSSAATPTQEQCQIVNGARARVKDAQDMLETAPSTWKAALIHRINELQTALGLLEAQYPGCQQQD